MLQCGCVSAFLRTGKTSVGFVVGHLGHRIFHSSEPRFTDDSQLETGQIQSNDQLLTASDFAQVIIAYHNGSPVKLSDVATVENDVENNRQAAWMNETPAVIVNIQRQPGANIIQVVDRIKKLLPLLKSNLPAAVQVDELTDRTITIRASVKDVEFELMLTVALVVMVIFLFLQIGRA